MTEEENVPFSEIERRLGISEAAAKMRRLRLKEKLSPLVRKLFQSSM